MDKQKIKEILDHLENHKLPVIKIQPTPRKAEAIWSSKFGGKPYWPKEKDYPVTKKGKPLYLLAQINFEETPELLNYPNTGILQFFIEDNDVYGMDFDRPVQDVIASPDGYRVIYHSNIIRNPSELEEQPPEAMADSYLPLQREYSLSFSPDNEMPSPTDYRYEQIAGDPYDYEDDVADYIYDNLTAEGSKLGGYASFTQDDPRRENEHNWVLLFQVDSDWEDGVEIMWGDMGVGNFFIQEEHLKNGDFSQVWYNWDCS